MNTPQSLSQKPAEIPSALNAAAPQLPWLMVLSRSALFLLIQSLIALLFTLFGNAAGWDEAPRWWTFVVTMANLASIGLLTWCMHREGKKYWDLLRFSRGTWKKDVLFLLGISVVGLPIAAAPMNTLAAAIFGDSLAPIHMMFRPLPGWALALAFLFPLTIAFSELPTYMGYCMPRIARQLNNTWLAWLIASFFLAAQHMFLPFIPDGRYMLWRLGMYLPFALFIGLVLKFRPQLMPYAVVIHALMDISTVAVYWMV